jgi:hypothetical protein
LRCKPAQRAGLTRRRIAARDDPIDNRRRYGTLGRGWRREDSPGKRNKDEAAMSGNRLLMVPEMA